MSKKYAELLLLGAFLVVAVLLYWSTADYPKAVQGSTAEYVRFLALSTGILCVLDFITTMRSKKSEKKLILSASPTRFWLLCVFLVLYTLSFSLLGFYVASALFLPLTMYMLGARNISSICLTTLGVLAFVYGIFEKTLEVYMPVGSLFQ